MGIIGFGISMIIAPFFGLYHQFSATVCTFAFLSLWLIHEKISAKERWLHIGFLILPFFLIYTSIPLILNPKGVLTASLFIDWAPIIGTLCATIIKKKKWVVAFGIVFLVFGSIFAENLQILIKNKESKVIKTISEAPDLIDDANLGINLSQYKGKTVLLDFWFRGCKPCEESMPDYQKLYNKYKNDPNVEFISVLSLDQKNFKRDSIFLSKEFKYNFPVLFDIDWKLANYLSVQSYPCLVIMDKDSYVRYQGDFNPKWYHFYNTERLIQKIRKTRI